MRLLELSFPPALRLWVVYLERHAATTELAAPAVAREHLASEPLVFGRLKPKPRALWEDQHDRTPGIDVDPSRLGGNESNGAGK